MSEAMWTEIKKEFLIGFNEGWTTFWSPFTGMWKAFGNTWKNHIGSTDGEIKATATKPKI